MFAAKDALLTRPSGGYVIPRSLRFRSSASAYLNRTPSVAATSSQKMTYSFWLKRGKLGVLQGIFDAGTTPSNDYSSITAADVIVWYLNNGGNGAMQTIPVFRDPSAGYHIMLVTDTTQAQPAGNAADSRLRIYVNGSQITSLTTATMPAQNYNVVYTGQNGAVQNLFRNLSTNYTDGYVADCYFIDGQALAPTSFGAINATTGVWAPIKYTGGE
mgnify:CR=1 FL=1